MMRRPPRSTRTAALFPSTTRVRSLRGVTLLFDSAPVNTADGSGDFQEIDPLMLSHLEVYRGANGLRFGASSLGGAINAVTPSARTLGHGFEARRSEEHTSDLQSLMRTSYAVFCLKKKNDRIL